MPKPQPPKIDPKDLPNLALAVIRADPFPHLATIDGFTIYVANLRSYGKTAEIAANPKVELCYLDEHHNQVRLTGVAQIVTDRAVLQEIWDSNALMRQYLGSLDNPQLIVYRISPNRVRYMQEWALEYYEVALR